MPLRGTPQAGRRGSLIKTFSPVLPLPPGPASAPAAATAHACVGRAFVRRGCADCVGCGRAAAATVAASLAQGRGWWSKARSRSCAHGRDGGGGGRGEGGVAC